jgi:plasmid stabilization system protein ParE
LATPAHRGRTPPELRPIEDRTWLELIESPWRILYRAVEDAVETHAILDGRGDLRDILFERMVD